MAVGKLDSLRQEYNVPRITNLKVLRLDEGATNLEGFTYKVAFYPAILSDGLQLPFCHPIHDVLDTVGVALAQLHPNTWRILVSCYVI